MRARYWGGNGKIICRCLEDFKSLGRRINISGGTSNNPYSREKKMCVTGEQGKLKWVEGRMKEHQIKGQCYKIIKNPYSIPLTLHDTQNFMDRNMNCFIAYIRHTWIFKKENGYISFHWKFHRKSLNHSVSSNVQILCSDLPLI